MLGRRDRFCFGVGLILPWGTLPIVWKHPSLRTALSKHNKPEMLRNTAKQQTFKSLKKINNNQQSNICKKRCLYVYSLTYKDKHSGVKSGLKTYLVLTLTCLGIIGICTWIVSVLVISLTKYPTKCLSLNHEFIKQIFLHVQSLLRLFF